MNKLLLLSFFSLFVFISNAQQKSGIKIHYPDNVNSPLTASEKEKIDEVYQSKADELVYNNDKFLKDVKHLLRNRITIYEDKNEKTQKKCKLLSEIPLSNTYNKDLKRDESFDINSFNPLKYQLAFFDKGTYVYRIDGTDYFIQITSQYRLMKN